MKKPIILIAIAIILASVVFVNAQGGVGIFARSNCASILNPVTNQTWCFDTSIGRIKVWTGTIFDFVPLVSSPVTVNQGGTGFVTATLNGVLLGNVTSPFTVTTAGTANQVFRVPGGGGAPAFGSIALNTSSAVTGTLGTVNGGTGGTGTPTNGQLLIGNGSGFTLATITAGNGITVATGSGSTTVTNNIAAGTGVSITGTNPLTIAAILHGQARLTFGSATQIKLCPYNGGNIIINGALFQLPSGCTTAANTSIFLDGTSGQNLAASTTYFVYLFSNSGTPTIDFSVTTHATDSSASNLGVEIKSGVSSRTLVGMIRTNGSSQFEDDNALRGVISWFNRREISLVNGYTTGRGVSSTSPTEMSTEIRGNFITWADESVLAITAGAISGDTTNLNVYTGIAFDGTTVEGPTNQIGIFTASIGVAFPIAVHANRSLSEGFHFATLIGRITNSGTGTYIGGAAGSQTALTVKIRG